VPTERDAARRAQLAVFLRARRARLRPADVGLWEEAGGAGRRRTPGLRREEVAQLSGVGVTWYTWLEQGRDIAASAQVVDALARALVLTGDQHRHLRELAGLPPPEREMQVGELLPRLQRLVDALSPNIAAILDPHFDYLVWNEAYVRLRGDPARFSPALRNMVWMMFTDPDNRARMARWEPAARAVLSQFRAAAGQRPDARFRELVERLSAASAEFAQWWADYPIRDFRAATIAVDQVALEMFQLRLVEQPDLLLVLQVPAGEADLARVVSLLG
jgi:hypothetical protein